MPRFFSDEENDDDPNIFYTLEDTFEWWSAIFMWQPVRAFILFWLSNMWVFAFGFTFAMYHWKLVNGFEGYDYSSLKENE